MGFVCQIKDQPSQPTLSVRTRSAAKDLLSVYSKAFASIATYLDNLGETPAGLPFAAFHNLDTRDLDVEIGFPVKKALPAKGEIRTGEIPAGKYVSTLFVGSYDQADPAYDALMAYAKENGFEFGGIAYEFYHEKPEILSDKSHTTIVLSIR